LKILGKYSVSHERWGASKDVVGKAVAPEYADPECINLLCCEVKGAFLLVSTKS